MKVFSISDLHMSLNCPKPMDIFGDIWDNYLDEIFQDWNQRVTENDIVLIPGDISWAMQLEKAVADLELIGRQKGKKIILRGNHDYWWKSISGVRGVLPKDMYALQNDSMKIGDCVFCGTRGWTVPEDFRRQPEDDKKIFNREILRLKLSLENAAKLRKEGDKLVAMLHFPPFDSKMNRSQFVELLLESNVDKVVYGHLHGATSRLKLYTKIKDTEFYLSSCDIVKNKLVEII